MTLQEEQSSKASDRLTNIVIGMSDGLVVPFALVSGFSNAVPSNSIIVTAGLIATGIGAAAMAMGGYQTVRTGADQPQAGTEDHHSETTVSGRTRREDTHIVAKLGLSEQTRTGLLEEVNREEDEWQERMRMEDETLAQPAAAGAGESAFAIGLGYLLGGLIPVAAYCFIDDTLTALKWSWSITIVSLFIFGWMKAVRSGRPALPAALRTVLFGAAAAAGAFCIASALK